MTITPEAVPNVVAHRKLIGLDHLRAIAISFVFVYHYGQLFPSPQWLTTISNFGWTGVDLFFVLSGYLISSQLFITVAKCNKISFREFFIKRFFRIVPTYLLIVTIYFVFPSTRERGSLAPLWKYLTFTQNLGLDLRSQSTFSHAWSLCIEEQFYLVLPLTLLILTKYKAIKKGLGLIIALLLFGIAIRWYVYETRVMSSFPNTEYWVNWYRWIYYPTYCRLDGLICGVTIASLFQFKPALINKFTSHGNLLLLLSIPILMGAFFVCTNQESFLASLIGFPLVSIGYGALVLGAISPTSFLYKQKSVFTTKMASLSYAIYLSHKMIIHMTQEQFFKLGLAKDNNWMLVICCITCLAGAMLMNKIIERPFQRLKEKIISTL